MQSQRETIYDIPLSPASVTRHIYLTEDFDEPCNYILTCQALLELEEYDIAEIHINSGGGSISVSNMIMNAMSKCKAPVKCVLESNADSAASVLFLKADQWEVSPNATMYLHVGFFSACGEKASDTLPDALFTQETHFSMIRDAYQGFLSEEEIDNLLKGVNLRLDSKDIIERLNNLLEYRAKQLQDMCDEDGEDDCYVEEPTEDELQQYTIKLYDGNKNQVAWINYDKYDNPIEMVLLDNKDIKITLEYQVMMDIYTYDFLKGVCVEYFPEYDKPVPKTKALSAERLIGLCMEKTY